MIYLDYIKAGSDGADRQTLHTLSSHKLATVRRRVAENPRVSIQTLKLLAQDPDPDVRIAVGLNKTTREGIIRKLLLDESVDVRYALAETSYLPMNLLCLLTEDDNCYVAERARRTIAARKVSEKLLSVGAPQLACSA